MYQLLHPAFPLSTFVTSLHEKLHRIVLSIIHLEGRLYYTNRMISTPFRIKYVRANNGHHISFWYLIACESGSVHHAHA